MLHAGPVDDEKGSEQDVGSSRRREEEMVEGKSRREGITSLISSSSRV